MEWYQQLSKQQRRQFWTVCLTCAMGAVLVLMVPAIFRVLF